MVLGRVCQPQTVGIAGVTWPVFLLSFQVEWETNSEREKKADFWEEKKKKPQKICSVGSLFYLRGVNTK